MTYELARDVPLAENDVAVCMTHGLFGSHLGVAFRDQEGKPKLVHLANHLTMMVQPYPAENWIAKVVPFHPDEALQILPFLRVFTERLESKGTREIEYGLNAVFGRGAFDLDGTYHAELAKSGYTCATIIVEFFHEPGFALLDATDWKADEANKAWGDAVVCMLKAGGKATNAHVDAVKADNIGIRITPEEVAAAAERPRDERPAKFATAHAGSEAILRLMLSKCGPPLEVPFNSGVVPCVRIYAATGKPCAVIHPPPQAAPPALIQPVPTFLRTTKVGRNDPCPCNSGKKFKQCCGR